MLQATQYRTFRNHDGDLVMGTTGQLVDLSTIATHSEILDLNLRALYSMGRKEEYEQAKRSLPAFTVSSRCLSRARGVEAAEAARSHTGIIQIDIDGLQSDVQTIQAQIARIRGCVIAFVSPSAAGVKGLFKVSPIPTTPTEHKQAWAYISHDIERNLGIVVDTPGNSVKHLCFVSYDEQAGFNADAEPFLGDWREFEIKAKQTTQAHATPLETPKQEKGENRSQLLTSWLGANYYEGDTESDLLSKAIEADATSSCGYAVPIEQTDPGRVARIVSGWIRGKEPIKARVHAKQSENRKEENPPHSADREVRDEENRESENPLDIPLNYEPNILGQWVAGRIVADRLGYVWDTETDEWFQSSPTHWERIQWDDIRADVAKRYLPPLIQYAAMRIALGDTDERKYWGRELGAIKRSLFERKLFQDGIRWELRKALTPPDPKLIATKSGVVDIETLSISPFDPFIHTHKFCCPISVTQGDLVNATGAEVYFTFFHSRFESEEMLKYAHALVGRAVLGKNHRAYMLLLGPRACGKTTWANCIQTALGLLACAVSELLFDQRGNHNSDMCDLIEYQPRLAFLPETPNLRIQGGIINQLTGGDRLRNRRPHSRSEVKGISIAMPVLYAESPPTIFGTTAGTIERQKTVRFVKLDTKAQNKQLLIDSKDPDSDIVRGAFVALMRSAHYVLKNGGEVPNEPERVAEATQEVMQDQDPFAFFVEQESRDLIGRTAQQILAKYKAHLAGPHNDPVDCKMTARTVGSAMGRLGWENISTCQKTDSGEWKTHRLWQPIGYNTPEPTI